MLPVLDIRNLHIQFRHENNMQTAVQDLSFCAYPGKITAIVGESGSGKSATALSILNLLPNTAEVRGDILFCANGETFTKLHAGKADQQVNIRGKQAGMVFQEPMSSLNPLMTCGQQVMESIMLHQHVNKSKARKICFDWFEKVELPNPAHILDRYPHQLSGGQKQRVMIAMAMCNQPALLIADEPTTALDVRVQKNILGLIRHLQEKTGMAVLLITHDLGLVADLADDIIVLYKGLAVEQGEAREILRNPKHNYTKALLSCRPSANSKNKRLPVIEHVDGSSASKVVLHAMPDESKSTSSSPALVVDNLLVQFPGKKTLLKKNSPAMHAVDGVSFTIPDGKIMGLVGESGCGKTTLGRAILQLVKPTSGKIILYGQELQLLSEKKLRESRKNMQVVFQDPYGSLNPRMSIGDAIMEPVRVHNRSWSYRQAKEKSVSLLEAVQLESDSLNRYPHQFSGGQRQRICIARALATEPSFMIFDESVSALDVSVQAQILNLINDLRRQFGLTALFISHDLSVVHYISDSILVMKEGKIVEQGDADEIFFRPREKYTRELIEAIPGKNIRNEFQ